MKKIILLILLLPTLAAAEHHRGHAIDRAQKAIDFFGGAINQAKKFDKFCDELKSDWIYEKGVPGNTGFSWEAVVKNYTNVTSNQAQNAIDLMLVPVVDLDQVRRIINQPVNETPLSALSRINTVSGVANSIHLKVETDVLHRIDEAAQAGDTAEVQRLAELGTTCAAYLRGIKLKTMKGWNMLDESAWHINDAIREEVYGDQAFICAGPNNHCE